MRVFLHTDVLLDVLARREPFARDSAQVWAAAERGQIAGLVSAISFTTVFHITRRTRSRDRALDAVKIIHEVFSVVPCDSAILDRAIHADLEDFEDAVQYFSALAAGADCIVTRHAAHFPADGPPVLTPPGLLAMHQARNAGA